MDQKRERFVSLLIIGKLYVGQTAIDVRSRFRHVHVGIHLELGQVFLLYVKSSSKIMDRGGFDLFDDRFPVTYQKTVDASAQHDPSIQIIEFVCDVNFRLIVGLIVLLDALVGSRAFEKAKRSGRFRWKVSARVEEGYEVLVRRFESIAWFIPSASFR